ncbi:hypothetical protein CC85DRAFT_268997 [Cutaneotrichosporon oleaginosum]|uniref:3-hydroxyacyl-CoA dehydrogenase n=1 Tax=Cutaneotrichosporon oleaginosum TaxID=879819 RepID=A0A0J0XXC8_9TREE|nr:uncharacterized protein CC85DRAFT_268997 [Cutaneotrichosporon oleaginosum]KLT45732.1 hypothetical protein CC85DRAFT_268997 [Cutaneotrichosporon oleaginosum]TXT04501.1 hypothetical protein COLE_07320 [Cutaneotrichosporon oleaginosum]
MSTQISTVAVYGAGLMGAGIAQVCAQAGVRVHLVDVSDAAISNGLGIIRASAARVGKKAGEEPQAYVAQVLGRIQTYTDPAAAVAGVDLVIESIVEDLALKQALFAALDRVAAPHTLFASNTSALLIAEIAADVSDARKALFGGLHFSNPVPVMKFCEVIHTPATSPATHAALLSFARRLGKDPVTCRDTPGFILNRLLLAYNREAVRMVERGDATVADIDKAMELGAGYPMGPFKLYDYVGLDTAAAVGKGWERRADQGWIPRAFVEPKSRLIEDMVAQGRLGRKSGRGFYDYADEKKKLR